MEENNQSFTHINTSGGAIISGNVETGGGSFVGRDMITNDLTGRDIIYIGKDKTYSILGLKYSRIGLTAIVLSVILISVILIVFFSSTFGLLSSAPVVSTPTVISAAIAIIISLGVIYYVSRYYLRKSNENSRSTLDKLRDVERSLFQEIDMEVSSLFEEHRSKNDKTRRSNQ